MDEDTPHPSFAPNGHTTGVADESDYEAAIPLVQRHSKGRAKQERFGESKWFGRRLGERLNGNGDKNLPVVLRQTV